MPILVRKNRGRIQASVGRFGVARMSLVLTTIIWQALGVVSVLPEKKK